jgi:hypothetical protein
LSWIAAAMRVVGGTGYATAVDGVVPGDGGSLFAA